MDRTSIAPGNRGQIGAEIVLLFPAALTAITFRRAMMTKRDKPGPAANQKGQAEQNQGQIVVGMDTDDELSLVTCSVQRHMRTQHLKRNGNARTKTNTSCSFKGIKRLITAGPTQHQGHIELAAQLRELEVHNFI